MFKALKNTFQNKPATPFVISFCERSGSTLLVQLLRNHHGIKCAGEEFKLISKNGVISRSKDLETRDQIFERLQFLLFGTTSDKPYTRSAVQARGFKIKYPKQENIYPEVREFLCEHADKIHVIQIVRKNKLKAAVSKQYQLHLASIGLPNNLLAHQRPPFSPFKLDIDQAIAYVSARETQDHKYQSINAQFPHFKLINYEELVGRNDEVRKSLIKFLGVEGGKGWKAETVKLLPEKIEQTITNYSDLEAALRQSEFEKYLDLAA